MRRGDAAGGWVVRTFDGALQQAAAAGIGFWQIVMIYGVVASDTGAPRLALVAAHLVIFGVAGAILVRRGKTWLLLPLVYAALLLDYRAAIDTGSALSFLCFWTSLVFAGMPFLLVRARHAVWFLALSLACSVFGLFAWHPRTDLDEVVLTVLSAIALAAAVMTMGETVRGLARKVDRQQAEATRERERLLLRRTVARTAADEARTMHDTMINTLSLVASGTRIVADHRDEVRERCARDAETVEALLEGQRHDGVPEFRPSAVTVGPGMRVRRTGLGDDALESYVSGLSDRVASAAQHAVEELVRNVEKHAGTDHVTVDIRGRDDALIVTVSDSGCGFDGRPVSGRGLAESVIARAREAGIDVSIRTAPGAGTAVTLTIDLTADAAAVDDDLDRSDAARRTVEMVRRTTCWRWATVMVAFGIVDVVIRRPVDIAAACVMLTVVGTLSLVAAWACRDSRMLPGWLTAVMVAAIPVAFIAGLASIDFGRTDVTEWPTIVLTALLTTLLVTRRSRTAFIVGVGVLVLTAGVTTGIVWLVASAAAAVIPTGVAVQLAVLTGWLMLDYGIVALGTRHERTLRKLVQDRLERASHERIITARARWTAAGARRSVALLRGIGDGSIDPVDPSVQRECAEAERYLRQVLLLNPETVHMSPWIGRALSSARSRRVLLTLRAGTVDAPSEDVAAAFGRTILAALDDLAPGTRLDVGLFPAKSGPQLLLVGPRASLGSLAAVRDLPGGCTVLYRQYGEQDLVEIAASAASVSSLDLGAVDALASDR